MTPVPAVSAVPKRVLVVNPGSSSMKLRILGGDLAGDDVVAKVDAAPDASVANAVAGMGPFDAIGCRVVHGGHRFTHPVLVDDGIHNNAPGDNRPGSNVLDGIRELTDLAPLHQPLSIAAIESLRGAWPGIPLVACFDTAFHAGLPPASATYALPEPWRTQWRLRRYGFHGLAHSYLSRRMAELTGKSLHELRIVTCHLGAGASLCAVDRGRSVDTTMGFTPLDGLVMATRSGSIDPGLVLWLLGRGGLTPDEVNDGLERRSGLVGLTGSPDMAVVVEAASRGEPDATVALDVYVHHLRAGIAAMTSAMGGVDAVVFGGGVGEHAPVVREQVAKGLAFLGLEIDQNLNNRIGGQDTVVSPVHANVAVGVATTREDIEIARLTRSLMGGDPV